MEKIKNRKIYVGGKTVDQWGTFKRNKKDIIQEFENEGETYILTKNFSEHYNKALIYQDKNNSNHYILISYNTIVAEINGSNFIVYGYYSETTKRHINSFLNFWGISALSKKDILNIENEWQKVIDFLKYKEV